MCVVTWKTDNEGILVCRLSLVTESRVGSNGETHHPGKGCCILDKCPLFSRLSWVLVPAL